MKNTKCLLYFTHKIKPTRLELKYVHETYDLIAEHFNHTRYAKWPKVKQFIDTIQQGSLIYDIGCGNGKYLNNNYKYIMGTDISSRLLETAIKKNPNLNLMVSDVLKLPIRSNSCDAVICIALLHHLSTKQNRIKAISEISRILKPSGKCLIYIWCAEQQLSNTQEIQQQYKTIDHNDNQDILIKWYLQQKYISKNIKDQYEFDKNKNSRIIKRYYHLFKRGEIEELIRYINNLEIIDSYYDKQNWCCLIQKIK